MLPFGTLSAAAEPAITVHRDPNCGCCLGWVKHLQKAGFPTKVLETKDLDAVKTRLGPGMEGGTPELYEVVLFGPAGRRSYMRFVGEKALG